jgi:alkyl hydroperoxide reductase subunit AhpC
MAALQPEFANKNTKIVGLSVDPVSNHERWVTDIEDTQGCRVNYPIIGDSRLEVAKLHGMLPAESGDSSEGRTAANSADVRTVFMIGPGKVLKPYLRIVPQPK